MISEKYTGYDFRKLLKAYEILYRLKLEEDDIETPRVKGRITIFSLNDSERSSSMVYELIREQLCHNIESVYLALSLDDKYYGYIEIRSLSELNYILDFIEKRINEV